MSKSILTPIKLAKIASDPTGSTALMYYNSSSNTIKFYNGTSWITLLSGSNAALFWRYTAAGSETTLSGLDSTSQTLAYTAGYEQVFLNGVMLVRGTDYTATDGSTITLPSALVSGDYVVVVATIATSLLTAGYAPIASPTFTGTVTLPLSTAGYVTTTSGGVINSVATIPNAGLTNSSVTVGTTTIALGASSTTLAGLTSVTSTSFVGALTGNADTVTNGIYTTTTSLPNVTSVNGTTIPSSSNLVVSADASLSIPTQTSNSGKYLTTNGTTLSWATVGSGTVTSIAAGTGLTGGTITTSGTIAIDTTIVPQLGTANTFTGTQTIPTAVLSGGTSDPTAPTGNALAIYAKNLSGKPFLFTEAAGPRITLMQNSLFQKNIGLFTPGAGSTTLPPIIGSGTYTQPTTAATLTARTLATTNAFTKTKRIGFVTSTTTGRFAGVYLTGAQWTIGDGSANGGFYFAFRFGISDATLVASPRMFLGLSSTVTTPSNVEPSTLTNIIGVGMGAADTNLKIFYGGSAAQTPIDLGTNFPVTTATNQGYEVIFSNAYTSNNSVAYQITNLNTGTVSTGTLTAATPGTQLPASTTYLGHQLWRTNNATAAAVGLDLGYVYCEGDAS